MIVGDAGTGERRGNFEHRVGGIAELEQVGEWVDGVVDGASLGLTHSRAELQPIVLVGEPSAPAQSDRIDHVVIGIGPPITVFVTKDALPESAPIAIVPQHKGRIHLLVGIGVGGQLRG